MATINGAEHLRYSWKHTISGHSNFRHSPHFRFANSGEPIDSSDLEKRYPASSNEEHRKFSAGFLVDTLWQAIRICGLAHDIGHLPMSHSFEGAIDKFCEASFREKEGRTPTDKELADERIGHTSHKEFSQILEEYDIVLKAAYKSDERIEALKKEFARFPIHEKRSLFILDRIFKSDALKLSVLHERYRELIYRLAFLILLSSVTSDRKVLSLQDDDGSKPSIEVDNNAFRFMKLIVAGSVDADRMDYTLRDSWGSGVDMGDFGHKKLIQSAILFRDRNTDNFRLGFHYRALGEIERFFAIVKRDTNISSTTELPRGWKSAYKVHFLHYSNSSKIIELTI